MPGCDYANARVRGMRGRLLGARGVDALLQQPDLPAVVERLRRSAWGPLPTGLVDLRVVERLLAARVAADLARIDHFLAGDRARLLFRAVLSPEDAWNLKTILRGLARGEPRERVAALRLPAFGFEAAMLAALAAQPDVEAAVAALVRARRPWARPLEEGLAAWRRQRDLLPLEAALDRLTFASALAAARADGEHGRVLAGLLEARIDLANTATLLKLPGGARAEGLFVPGGRRLRAPVFARLLARDPAERRQALARYPALRLAPLAQALDPFLVDRLLERRALALARAAARTAPLSLAVPLAYVLELRAELRQLRLVLEARALGLPADQLVDLLVGGA